jgi:hypothetical protein
MSSDSLSPLAISRATLKEAHRRIELNMPYDSFSPFDNYWAALKKLCGIS